MRRIAFITLANQTQGRLQFGARRTAIWLVIGITGYVIFAAVAYAGRGGMARVDLQSIATNGETIVAVGAAGAIVRSTDGGSNWDRISAGLDASLINVSVCPDGSFMALDFYRRVWVGDDKGEGWSSIQLPGETISLASTCAPDGSYWVIGEMATVHLSQNKGANWETFYFAPEFFGDAPLGAAVGEEELFEGFGFYDEEHVEPEVGEEMGEVGEEMGGADLNLTAVQFVNKEHVVIAGEYGVLIVSVDGGRSWQSLPRLPDNFYTFDMWFENTQRGWVTGRAGHILYTENGGQSWLLEDNLNNGGVPMYGLIPAQEEGRLFAIGELGVVLERGIDGWHFLADDDWVRPGGYLRKAIFSSSEQALIAVGGAGVESPMFIRAGSVSRNKLLDQDDYIVSESIDPSTAVE